ncbi:hypothetical protein Godav_012788, partial [Gossypium davidsonii]|nr:hypothetical protein [Gossypium davidsonii]
MKKALGLKSPGSKKSPGSAPSSGQGKSKRPTTVGELMRIQMRVPESVDARVRRALLRIGGGLVGRRIESVVLPLELLQQLKQSDFSDQQEYALDRPIETGKNNESMQVLRSAVMSLASRSDGSLSDSCHWADVEMDLLYAADGQLAEVAKDAKTTRDPEYSKILSSTLSSILGWAEKRLLAYHDTFDSGNVYTMQGIVSLGVSAAKILVEDVSTEYRRKRKEVDVARNRIDTYIRSSLRTAFAQADSSRRASKNQPNPLPVLAILAKDVGELAVHEKQVFSPILKGWHPLAAGITELTPDAVQVLRAADKLEKDLVQIAVEDAVDSDDGGKAIIREMPPYEAETAIANLVKGWIKTRLDRLKEWVWNPQANQEGFALSAVETLRIIDETLDAFFQLPIPAHPALLPDVIVGLDKCLQYYVIKAKSGCASRNTYIPTMPALTRCEIGSKFQGLCVRINTLHHIRSEMDVLEKRIVTHLRNCESAHLEDFSSGLSKRFELTPAACVEGVQQLSEAVAYKIVFHDLSHVLWDGLYVGEPSSSRINPLLQELEQNLLVISETVHDRDSQIIEDDFKALKDLFWANGDGLPADLIDKFSATVRDVLPLFRTNTESLIERFKRMTLEAYGSSARSRLPLPPTSGQWNPNEPNTLLRVLCYR